MTSGYYMLDASGVDLTSQSTQTKTGIYKELQRAMKTGKPLIGYGMIWGEGKPLTPIHFFANQYAENLIVCTSSILNINVTNEDVITVQDLTN